MTSSTAAIHVAKKQLGLDDDTYRAKLARITGKSSTKDMSEDERQKVLTVLRDEGFQPAAGQRRRDGRRKLTGKYRAKLQALWIAGYNLGIIRNRDDAAMLAFIKSQTGADDTRFLHEHAAATAAIEGLKGWLAREGGVVWRVHPNAPPWAHVDGYRIAKAQWHKLSPNSVDDFWPVVTDLLDRPIIDRDFTAADWMTVMNLLGERIRREKRPQP